MLPLRARVDLEAMALKGYPAFPKAPALSKGCILQPQSTGTQVRVDLGVTAMKGYSIFPRATGLEPHHSSVMSYPGHSMVVLNLLCKDAVYSTAQAEWVGIGLVGTEVTNIRSQTVGICGSDSKTYVSSASVCLYTRLNRFYHIWT